MKNVLKVLGIIALVAVIGFSMVSCAEEEENKVGKKELSGKATVNVEGCIFFGYQSGYGSSSSCKFTTDLPAPNDSFEMYSGDKTISGLTVGQKVNWTAKVDEGFIAKNQGTKDGSSSVYIIGSFK